MVLAFDIDDLVVWHDQRFDFVAQDSERTWPASELVAHPLYEKVRDLVEGGAGIPWTEHRHVPRPETVLAVSEWEWNSRFGLNTKIPIRYRQPKAS